MANALASVRLLHTLHGLDEQMREWFAELSRALPTEDGGRGSDCGRSTSSLQTKERRSTLAFQGLKAHGGDHAGGIPVGLILAVASVRPFPVP